MMSLNFDFCTIIITDVYEGMTARGTISVESYVRILVYDTQ